MLFGRKKPGFITEVEAVPEQAEGNAPKQDLLAYMESLPEAESDEFGEVPIPEETVEAPEMTEAQHLAAYIRLRTQGIELTPLSSLLTEVERFRELEAEWEQDETCRDIVCVEGKQDVYYFSTEFMSQNYAMITVLVVEKDIPRTIAQMVRFNCKTYPVPTPFGYFERTPYLYTKAQLERAIAIIENRAEYQDIQILNNNMGDPFFYSTEHMSQKYARALANVDEYTD